uniref:Uncharacterized protein n=1 Tax=Romanomermis culicivorax TaxID=13658 RepID=A0A915KHN3_ROMCU
MVNAVKHETRREADRKNRKKRKVQVGEKGWSGNKDGRGNGMVDEKGWSWKGRTSKDSDLQNNTKLRICGQFPIVTVAGKWSTTNMINFELITRKVEPLRNRVLKCVVLLTSCNTADKEEDIVTRGM